MRAQLDAAIAAINEAKKLNDKAQSAFAVGSIQWLVCEAIDDRLHNALIALGD